MSPWSLALREQARSDHDAAVVLCGVGFASQATMLFQMAWEKLAKAALATGGSWDPTQRTHRVAAKFVSVLKRAPAGEKVLGKGYTARITRLQKHLVRLEALTPALANGENAEYPWSAGANIHWPAKHLTRDFVSGRVVGLGKDFEWIMSKFSQLFQ